MAKSATTRSPEPFTHTEEHEHVMRQIAAKIITLLPADETDSRRILGLAGAMHDSWLSRQALARRSR